MFSVPLYVFAFLDAYFTAREMSLGTDAHIEKNPRVAAVLNFLTGGFGYWYVGQKGKAVAWFLIVGAFGRSSSRVENEIVSASLGLLAEVVSVVLAVDGYRFAKRKAESVLDSLGLATVAPTETRQHFGVRVPLGLACLFALVYIEIATVGLLPESPWEKLTGSCEAAIESGSYNEVEDQCSAAVTEVENFGPDDPRLARSLNNLGVLYLAQERNTEAEPLIRRALVIEEKTLGLEHLEVGRTLNNLAGLYTFQGKYSEAELLYKRSLAIKEKALGPADPDLAITMGYFGTIYLIQKKYAEAEPLLLRSLAIRERALGPEHPDVAANLYNPGGLHYAQGNYIQAEVCLKRALAIWNKVLEPENPNVAQALQNYATLLREMGRDEEAEKMESRAQAIRGRLGNR